jgi:hypothetical protein
MTGSPQAESPAPVATQPPTVRARLVKPLDVPRMLALLHEAALVPRVRTQVVGP